MIWDGRPALLAAPCYYAQRSSDGNFASGAMASILTLSLPADSPAGRYAVDVFTVASSTSACTLNIRCTASTTGDNLTGDLPVTLPANTRVATTVPVVFDHGGGAATLTLAIQVSAGTGTAYAGARLRASRIA